MQNPVEYLRWSLLQKYLLTFNHELFLQKRILNASLNFLESWGQILILCMGGICIVGFFTSFLDNISGLSGSG